MASLKVKRQNFSTTYSITAGKSLCCILGGWDHCIFDQVREYAAILYAVVYIFYTECIVIEFVLIFHKDGLSLTDQPDSMGKQAFLAMVHIVIKYEHTATCLNNLLDLNGMVNVNIFYVL